jgi:hypothetical protein
MAVAEPKTETVITATVNGSSANRPTSKRDRNNNNRVSRGEPPPIPPRPSQQNQLKQLKQPPPAPISQPHKKPPQSSKTPKVSYVSGSLADDCYVCEETGDDCVYQITIKKVFNKNLSGAVNASSADTMSSSATMSSAAGSGGHMTKNYSDYRLSSHATANAFKLLMPVSSSSSNLLSNYGATTTSATSNNDDTSHNNNNNNNSTGLVYTRVVVKQLKYASLKKFIEHLTSEETGELDSSLVQTFLATYRTFSDTRTVLEAIARRYEEIVPASLDMTEDVRVESLRSFRCLIKMWLDGYSEDFNEPPEFANLATLRLFVLKHMSETELTQVIDDKLAQFKVSNAAALSDSTSSPKFNGHFLKVCI